MIRIALIFLLFTLSGCQRSPAEELLDDYLTRLARVLRQTQPEVEKHRPIRLPEARDLQVNIEPLSIDLLDYWAFRKCGLAPLLAERNSVLGRVMQPSQALLMDGRLLRQLAVCEQQLEDAQMLQLTAELIELKSQQWPLRYWNATVAAPELRQFWSPSAEPLRPAEEESFRSGIAALTYFTRVPQMLYSDAWPESAALELHYQQLGSYQLGGRLIHSLQLGSAYLQSANHLLRTATEQRSLCPHGLQHRELEYARNVMTQVFIGQVQSWFAMLNRDASALLSGYHNLIAAQSPDLQPRIEPHQKAVQQVFDQFRELNREHVRRWKTLFEVCDSKAIPD